MSEPQIVPRIRGVFIALAIATISVASLGVSSPAALAQEKTKIRAAYVPVATWLPLWVAKDTGIKDMGIKDMGIFEKNGLDVSPTSFPILALLPPTVGKQFDLAPTTASC